MQIYLVGNGWDETRVVKVMFPPLMLYAESLIFRDTAHQALIQRHGIVRPPLTDSDAIGGDRRLYAAALEVVVGSHCHVRWGFSNLLHRRIETNTTLLALTNGSNPNTRKNKCVSDVRIDRGTTHHALYYGRCNLLLFHDPLRRPERLAWSLQRLIRTIRMADQNNLEVVADRAAENEAKEAEGVPLEDRTVWEQDAMVAISLEIFFPGALKGVDGADKVGAGDIHTYTSYQGLGLMVQAHVCWCFSLFLLETSRFAQGSPRVGSQVIFFVALAPRC